MTTLARVEQHDATLNQTHKKKTLSQSTFSCLPCPPYYSNVMSSPNDMWDAHLNSYQYFQLDATGRTSVCFPSKMNYILKSSRGVTSYNCTTIYSSKRYLFNIYTIMCKQNAMSWIQVLTSIITSSWDSSATDTLSRTGILLCLSWWWRILSLNNGR